MKRKKFSHYEDTDRRQELIKKLRQALCLKDSDIEDDELLNMTRGSLIMTEIEIGMCLLAIKRELKNAFEIKLFKGWDDALFKWIYEKVKDW